MNEENWKAALHILAATSGKMAMETNVGYFIICDGVYYTREQWQLKLLADRITGIEEKLNAIMHRLSISDECVKEFLQKEA